MGVIHIARKPVDGTLIENIVIEGCGALHIRPLRLPASPDDDIWAKNPHTQGGFGHAGAGIYNSSDGAAVYDPSLGRWPPNVILADCSDHGEEARFFPTLPRKRQEK